MCVPSLAFCRLCNTTTLHYRKSVAQEAQNFSFTHKNMPLGVPHRFTAGETCVYSCSVAIFIFLDLFLFATAGSQPSGPVRLSRFRRNIVKLESGTMVVSKTFIFETLAA